MLRRRDRNTQPVDPLTESGTTAAWPAKSFNCPEVVEGLALRHDRTTVVSY
ncbi:MULTISPECIES: hypothetical protein [Streptomyces]|uniref:Uncharacterized protein n=1 Tax=Streptomyces flaveolus TaxID=67297 RepID=A0ABV1VEG4_9ACTN